MNEIEAKRNELFEDTKILYPTEYTQGHHFGRLQGFNLGVEMARKEILETINDMIIENKESTGVWTREGYIKQLEKIKQSLEEKK